MLAGVYWLAPAGSLPSYAPGFGVDACVFKHGLIALILALVLFVFAWVRFPKSSSFGFEALLRRAPSAARRLKRQLFRGEEAVEE